MTPTSVSRQATIYYSIDRGCASVMIRLALHTNRYAGKLLLPHFEEFLKVVCQASTLRRNASSTVSPWTVHKVAQSAPSEVDASLHGALVGITCLGPHAPWCCDSKCSSRIKSFIPPGATFQMSKQPLRLQTCVMAAGMQPELDLLCELLVRRGAGTLLKSGLDISSEAGVLLLGSGLGKHFWVWHPGSGSGHCWGRSSFAS